MNHIEHHRASLSDRNHRAIPFCFAAQTRPEHASVCPKHPPLEDAPESGCPSAVGHDFGGQAWKARFDSLTSRERDVLHWIVEEKLSKQIADLLGISRKTVDFHRAHVMQKLQARSLVHLVKMAVKECVV